MYRKIFNTKNIASEIIKKQLMLTPSVAAVKVDMQGRLQLTKLSLERIYQIVRDSVADIKPLVNRQLLFKALVYAKVQSACSLAAKLDNLEVLREENLGSFLIQQDQIIAMYLANDSDAQLVAAQYGLAVAGNSYNVPSVADAETKTLIKILSGIEQNVNDLLRIKLLEQIRPGKIASIIKGLAININKYSLNERLLHKLTKVAETTSELQDQINEKIILSNKKYNKLYVKMVFLLKQEVLLYSKKLYRSLKMKALERISHTLKLFIKTGKYSLLRQIEAMMKKIPALVALLTEVEGDLAQNSLKIRDAEQRLQLAEIGL